VLFDLSEKYEAYCELLVRIHTFREALHRHNDCKSVDKEVICRFCGGGGMNAGRICRGCGGSGCMKQRVVCDTVISRISKLKKAIAIDKKKETEALKEFKEALTVALDEVKEKSKEEDSKNNPDK
jgi:TM2 domain-containing membrane protein YozV